MRSYKTSLKIERISGIIGYSGDCSIIPKDIGDEFEVFSRIGPKTEIISIKGRFIFGDPRLLASLDNYIQRKAGFIIVYRPKRDLIYVPVEILVSRIQGGANYVWHRTDERNYLRKTENSAIKDCSRIGLNTWKPMTRVVRRQVAMEIARIIKRYGYV